MRSPLCATALVYDTSGCITDAGGAHGDDALCAEISVSNCGRAGWPARQQEVELHQQELTPVIVKLKAGTE